MTLTAAQIAVSILIVLLILLQERSSGISGLFGGGGESVYQTRRGMEKMLFYTTVIAIIVFAGLALLNLLI